MIVRPETVGLSSERLHLLDTFVEREYISAGRMPGALISVMRRGDLVHHSALGMRDVEGGRPVEPDTIFRIYSMTKPIVSVAFMMLVEEGLVALDDPVHRFIPEWRDLGVFQAGVLGQFQTRPPERPMLIVDLLRHTSGLTYGFQQRSNVDAAYRELREASLPFAGSLEQMIAHLAELPLEFSPGASWNYSVSTDVLGYLVERLSGQTLDVFLKQRLFDPLGMVDTDFHVPDDKIARFAACYEVQPGVRMALQDRPETSSFRTPPTMRSGGGGLVSTAADYLRFCRMMLNQGALDGRRYLSRKTVGLMTANHLPGRRTMHEMSISLFSEAAYAGAGFGLGVAVTTDPVQCLVPVSTGEYFWGGLASTAFWIDPQEELIVVFMTQLMPSTLYPIRRQLRTLVYAALTD